MNFLLQAFSEGNGNPSSMRVMTFIVVASIMAGWLATTVHTHAMAPLPVDGTGAIILGSLGIKAWQRGRETKSKETSDTTFTTKT